MVGQKKGTFERFMYQREAKGGVSYTTVHNWHVTPQRRWGGIRAPTCRAYRGYTNGRKPRRKGSSTKKDEGFESERGGPDLSFGKHATGEKRGTTENTLKTKGGKKGNEKEVYAGTWNKNGQKPENGSTSRGESRPKRQIGVWGRKKVRDVVG